MALCKAIVSLYKLSMETVEDGNDDSVKMICKRFPESQERRICDFLNDRLISNYDDSVKMIFKKVS